MQISHNERAPLSLLFSLSLPLSPHGIQKFSIKIQFKDPQCSGAGMKMLEFVEDENGVRKTNKFTND